MEFSSFSLVASPKCNILGVCDGLVIHQRSFRERPVMV